MRKETDFEVIEKVLDEEVRPYLRSHQGDVEIVGMKEGILRVRLQGQCMTCPSASLTTKYYLEDKICQAIPEIRQVELADSVDPDLLRQAREILFGKQKED